MHFIHHNQTPQNSSLLNQSLHPWNDLVERLFHPSWIHFLRALVSLGKLGQMTIYYPQQQHPSRHQQHIFLCLTNGERLCILE